MATEPLRCPHCEGSLTLNEILEGCTSTDPVTGLLRLLCPRCGAQGAVRLQDGRVELGLAAVEGSAFRPTATAPAPELFVRRDPSWVDCWLGKVYRRFPVDGHGG